MTCEVVRTYLSDFIDGVLPAGIVTDISEHLVRCLSCADIYHTLPTAEGFYGAARGCEVTERLGGARED